MSRIYDAWQRATGRSPEVHGAAGPPVGDRAARDWILPDFAAPVPVTPSPGPTDVAALAGVPCKHVDVPTGSRLVVSSDPDGLAADRIRYLRMLLREHGANGRLRTVLITSPQPGDGKSTIALNLATALAERGKSTVAFVEADFYHPTVGGILGLQSANGLADCLEDGLDPVRALFRMEPLGWYCLPSGRPKRNPAGLLQSDALPGVMRKLRSLFDWVVIDSPPLLPISDALLLALHADASLLIVRAGRTSSGSVEEALARLGPRRVLGIVLNGAEDISRRYGYYYHYCR